MNQYQHESETKLDVVTKEDIEKIDQAEQKHGNRIHALEVKLAAQHKELNRLRREIGRLKNQIDHVATRVHRG